MKYLVVWLKWLLMGMCDVIPGVSGGTIAFITWIYDELLDALHGFNMHTLYVLSRGGVREAWKMIHWNFLVSLFLGIVIAIVTLANVVTYLLEVYPSFVWAFFSWLILASVVLLRKMLGSKKMIYILWILLWWAIWFAITSLPALSFGDNLWSLFAAWAIAIIAMILPGISGSYILLILGKYNYVLWLVSDSTTALSTGDIASIPYIALGVFVLWIVIWLLLFSRVLWWIKEHYHDQMIVVLMWFMLWAMQAIRPWKQTISTYVDSHGLEKPLIQQNVLWPNTEALLYGLLFALLGVVIMLGIQYAVSYKSHDKK